MEEEVESLVLSSDGYLCKVYEERIGEMEENAKTQDAGNKTASISILILNELHVLLCLTT